VRVVSEDGRNLGVMSIYQALTIAEDTGLDLVEVAPNVNPPVCKLMDYGKYKYLQRKKAHEAKKHVHVGSLKEVRLHLKTDPHDLALKVKKIRAFIEDLHRVQVTMFLRGRERRHADMGVDALMGVWSQVEDLARLEREPNREGNRITILVGPKPELIRKKEQEIQQRRKQKETAGTKGKEKERKDAEGEG